MKLIATLILIAVLAAAIVGPQAFFVVDETQVAVVTRFGDPVRSIKSPGLYVKTPFIERVQYLDKRLLVFDAPPDSLLTKDKKRLVIDVYARGRITNPLRFVETLRTESRAASRAIDIVASELRREIGLDDQSEIIQTSRELIMNRVRDAVEPKLLDFGIQIVDVRMKRADFPGEIANSIYERMQAERKRIADRERAAGTKADLEKRASVDRQALIITSEAERDADIIRGCGQAEATKIFADALSQGPEFYTFQRSLETYRLHLTENTLFVGSSSDLGAIFEDIRKSAATAAEAPSGSDGSAVGQLESKCQEIGIETAARKLLGDEVGVGERGFILDSTESVQWPDASLGCPQEGQGYAQVITPGYKLVFDLAGTPYEVHSNVDGSQMVICGGESEGQ
jgi:membrane protease subunit HflC